jgi:hypothetical protein
MVAGKNGHRTTVFTRLGHLDYAPKAGSPARFGPTRRSHFVIAFDTRVVSSAAMPIRHLLDRSRPTYRGRESELLDD